MVGLYNSTISHEMILPLKNIVAVSSSLEEAFEATSEKGKQIHLVKISGQMLLTQIKMQLDYNLMKHDKFKPILESASVRSVVDETIEMLRIQAKHS